MLGGSAALVVGLLVAPVFARGLQGFRWTRSLAQLASDSGVLWRRRGRSLAILLVGFGIQLSTLLCVWMIALSVGAEISFTAIVAVILPVQLALAVPISVAGWGVREGAMVFGLGLAGVPNELGLVISVLWGVLALIGGVGCWVAWFRDPRVREEARGLREASDGQTEQVL